MLMSAALTQAPAGVVLLAAGRGSRMFSLTEYTHKSLLPVAGSPRFSTRSTKCSRMASRTSSLSRATSADSVERFVRADATGIA